MSVILGMEKSALSAAKFLYTVHVSEIVSVEVVSTNQSGMVIYAIDDKEEGYRLWLSKYGGIELVYKDGVEEPIFYTIE